MSAPRPVSRLGTLPFVLPLLLATALLAARAGAEGDAEVAPPSLPPTLEAALEAAVAAGGTTEDAEALARQAVLAGDRHEALLARLDALAEDETRPAAWRQDARLLAARLQAARGERRSALERARAVAETTDEPRAHLLAARLLDRLGRVEEAREAFAALAEAPLAPDEAALVRIRSALLAEADDEAGAAALAAYAARPEVAADIRDRAAIVLALRQRPAEAVALFEARGEGRERFRQEVRLADWALRAEAWAEAREHAWRAVRAATLRRDRRYALALLVQAARAMDDLDGLLARLAAASDLPDEARETWIDLLRETGRVEEALRLFREGADGAFTPAMRRELLEICRAAGRDDLLLEAYAELIAEEPASITWREGLARHHLERGDREAALAVWRPYVSDPALARFRLAAAESLAQLGLDGLAVEAAESRIPAEPAGALLFLFDLHRRRGRLDDAEAALVRLDEALPAAAPARKALGEAWERIGRADRAIETMEGLREARGPGNVAEDLEMRLAWLHTEAGNEEVALERWRTLWREIDSVARRRYVEDRMMTVAARLGVLADIAIALEERLAAGEADARDSGLLVRLYTRVGDSVSATEVIEEYMRRTGGDPVDTLVEKARVFLACKDHHGYEQTIHQLIEIDGENEGDYLRQLAMSQLERGRPDEAREVLGRLREVDAGSDGAEFEAGVLALAGLREEAIAVYRRGLAEHPDRIEAWLLLGGLLAEVGQEERAVGLFQHLAEHAERDDLFTVAIDGLLNVEAPAPALRWALRATMERLARRHDALYLYRLIADLAAELGDRDLHLSALENALPIAGEQRLALLRELMDLARARTSDRARHLAYGRRLLGLGEVAPPQVYLDLGTSFLAAGEVTNAARTFALATGVPDWAAFQRQVAAAFEGAGYPREALATYERLLVSRTGDVSLLAKVGELHEQLGRDDRARELYGSAIDLLLARRPFTTAARAEEEDEDPWAWMRARNVGDYEQHYERVLVGLLVTLDGEEAAARLAAARRAVEADLARRGALEAPAPRLAAWPRLEARAALARQLAFAFGHVDAADAIDRALLAAFDEDEDLLEALVDERAQVGLVESARRLIAASGRDEATQRRVGWRVGGLDGGGDVDEGFLPPGEALRLVLPRIAAGDETGLRAVLRRVDLNAIARGEEAEGLDLLMAAAFLLEDPDVALRLARTSLVATIAGDGPAVSPWLVAHQMSRLSGLLDATRYRALCDHATGLVLEAPKERARWFALIGQLQATVEGSLLDAARVDTLLDALDEGSWMSLGPLLGVLPAEERTRAVRAMLPRVAPTRRLWFLSELLRTLEGEVSDDLADLLADAFREGVEAIGRDDRNAFSVLPRLLEIEGRDGLVLRLVDIAAEAAGDDPLVLATRAAILERVGREEEARAIATEVYADVLHAPRTEYLAQRARALVLEHVVGEDVAPLLALLDREAVAGRPTRELVDRRLELLQRAGRTARMEEVLRHALERWPEETGLGHRLHQILRAEGRVVEAMAVLEDVVEHAEDDRHLRQRLVGTWLDLRHPVRALAAWQAGQADETEEPDAEMAEPPALRHVRIQDVKASLEAGEIEEARRRWRRLWRSFPVGDRRTVVIRHGRGGRRIAWPPDPPAEADEDEEPPYQGGLSSLRARRPDGPEPPSAREVLVSRTPWGEDELVRELRTLDGAALAEATSAIDALAAAQSAALGRQRLAEALLAEAEAGAAGALEHGLLLAVLEAQPDLLGEDAHGVLEDLLGTVAPGRIGTIRRLARVWAARGETERAARLFRWCGTQARSDGRSYSSATETVPARDLVAEVADVLDGERRDETIASILAMAEPTPAPPYGAVDRDGHDRLVLETWTDVLGPDEALARTRSLCEDLETTERGLRRAAALRAARLLAVGGELARARRCLEHAVCRHEPPPDVPTWQRRAWERASFGRGTIDVLLPEEDAERPSQAAWAREVAEACLTWIEGGRLEVDLARDGLALLALRLHAAQAPDAAGAVLDLLAAEAGDEAADLLWVLDVARAIGQPERAWQIERRLLERGRLHVERLPEAIARVAADEGPEAALALGRPALAWTRHPDLLVVLEQAAEAAGDATEAARMATLRAEAAAARTALEAALEAQPD